MERPQSMRISPSKIYPDRVYHWSRKDIDRTPYNVDISCSPCKHAIESEVSQVQVVESVEVDVQADSVTVNGGSLDETAIVGAIDEAGYEVASP